MAVLASIAGPFPDCPKCPTLPCGHLRLPFHCSLLAITRQLSPLPCLLHHGGCGGGHSMDWLPRQEGDVSHLNGLGLEVTPHDA